jgi:phage terminase Nu1 subunit (DNA packaging protein)
MPKSKKRAILTSERLRAPSATLTLPSGAKPLGTLPSGAYDSISQAAASLGVTKSFLQNLKRQGAPGFHGSRVYRAELLPYLEDQQKAAAAGQTKMPLRELLENRRLLAQCKRIEHALAADSRSVIPLEPVRSAISVIGEQLKAALRSIYEDELPPILSGLSPESIRLETRKANDRLCAMLFAGTAKILP